MYVLLLSNKYDKSNTATVLVCNLQNKIIHIKTHCDLIHIFSLVNVNAQTILLGRKWQYFSGMVINTDHSKLNKYWVMYNCPIFGFLLIRLRG